MRKTSSVRGAAAERQALTHLQSQGCVLVQANLRCRIGEIDLIVRHGHTLVFVEVRQRRSAAYGGALHSIGPHKQRRIIAAARWYLMQQAGPMPDCRFDVVTFEAGQIHWIRAAFDASE